MAEDNAAPAANDTAAPAAPATPAPPPGPEPVHGSQQDIMAMLARKREAARAGQPPPVIPRPADRPPPRDDTEPAEAPGETEVEDEAPEEEPPVELPKSLSRDERDAIRALPRDHQQAIADRQRARDADYQRGFQEAADKAKAADAKIAAAEQARQQYEQALPGVYQAFQAHITEQFSDIKTWEDVEKMQNDDPYRYQKWDVAVKKAEALKNEVLASQQRQQAQYAQQFQAWQADQQARFQKAAPEFFDSEKGPKLWSEVRATLKETGIEDQELDGLWSGGSMPFHDHRTQLLIRDAMRYRKAQKALANAKPKPVPPVQRPGTAAQRGAPDQQHLKELTAKMRTSGQPKDIAAFLTARRAAAARK